MDINHNSLPTRFTVTDFQSPSPWLTEQVSEVTISHDSNNASNPVTYHGIPLTVLDNPASTIPLGQTVPHQPKKQRQVSIFAVSQGEDINPSKKSTKGISLLTGNPAELHIPARETIIYYIPQSSVTELPTQDRTEVLGGAAYLHQDSSHQIVNPGNDLESFYQKLRNDAGKILITPALNNYFKAHNKEIIRSAFNNFSNNFNDKSERDDYLQTMRGLLRKHTNKIAARDSRKRKADTSQKLEEALAGARDVLKKAKVLTDTLESQLSAALIPRNQPIHNTLSELKKVLKNVHTE